ncbi:MAG: class I SAM-dependent methyltransferase [Candidatus Diapherotrites archaeon]
METEKTKKPIDLYFGMHAEIGITKHIGGKKATNELIDLCRIDESKYVLDVGCGVGKTACYLAKEIGCKVMGIDLYEGMIRESKKRAKRKGIEDKVEFKVADAQNMPFADNTFDAVICESVVAFFDDKQKGITEFKRVAKPGGHVGINELTWSETPTEEIIDYMERTMGGDFHNSYGWKKLLESSGLKDISVKFYRPNALKQFLDELSLMELRDFAMGYKVILLFIKNKEYRNYMLGLTPPTFNIAKYLGNGIYIGRK